jgi:phosphatidylinositol glycan class C protein
MGVAERRRSSAAASTRDRSDASRANADGDETDPANPPWRRILYERQGYPDNHTDDSFLERLVLNGRVVPRRFTRVALDATAVSQQLAVVALKASATASLLSGKLSARDVLACDAGALAAGAAAIVAAQINTGDARRAIVEFVRVGALMLMALGALTPLFQTMTAAISDDTAFATAACALFVSVLTHDYALLDSQMARAGNSVSLGTSMFAASILASRLEKKTEVFADMLLSVLLFVLFPFFGRVIKARVPAAGRVAFAAAAHAAAALCVSSASAGAAGTTLAAAYVAVVLFVVIACPLWLVRMMRFKRQINGPWDEAKPSEGLAKRRRATVKRNGHGVGF